MSFDPSLLSTLPEALRQESPRGFGGGGVFGLKVFGGFSNDGVAHVPGEIGACPLHGGRGVFCDQDLAHYLCGGIAVGTGSLLMERDYVVHGGFGSLAQKSAPSVGVGFLHGVRDRRECFGDRNTFKGTFQTLKPGEPVRQLLEERNQIPSA